MKIRIEKQDCKFIVKPEERKVICIYYINPEILIDYLTDSCAMYTDYKEYNMLKMRHYYTGMATCASEDEWNEDTGKLIAFAKMKKKFCSSVFRHINRFFDARDNEINRAAEICDRMGEKWNKEIDTIDKEIRHRLGE